MAKRSHNSRDERDRWDIGGGGLDWGLTAKDNIVKEIQEEYTATPESVDFLGYRDVFRETPDGKSTHWMALDFVAKVPRADMAIGEPEKFDDSGWFTLEKLPSPLHSQEPYFFEKYHDKLRSILES